MQGIEVTLKRNKQYIAENTEEYEVISGENNATTILVHFPEEYKDYSKRVDFKNVRNEKWSIGLYTPEDETKNYGEDFDKLNFAFTLPTAVTINGELSIQFIAYLADNTETFVPFKLFKIIVEDSIMYVKKQGSDNPDLMLQTYEYANMALEISRDAFNKIENAERAALESEISANNAENSAKNAQESANSAQQSASSANTRAINAEASAKAAQESAEYAEQVADDANAKSDNAVATSNSANEKSDNAVDIANIANTNSEEALEIANRAETNSNTAITTADSASEKSDTAITTANDAKDMAEEALNQVVEKMGTKIFTAGNTVAESSIHVDEDIQTQFNKVKDNTTIVANSDGGFSCGSGATNGKGMQFKSFTICDENGKIPVARLFDAIYPVGSIYISTISTNPGTLFGGTWEAYAQGRTIIGNGTSDQSFTAGATGGSSTHTLTTNEMPSHTHTQNSHNHSQNSHTHTFHGYNQTGGMANVASYSNSGTINGSGVLSGSQFTDNHGNADGTGSLGGSLHFSMTPTGYNDGTTATNNATTATNQNTGGGGSHNNLQPYIVTYIWRRTA